MTRAQRRSVGAVLLAGVWVALAVLALERLFPASPGPGWPGPRLLGVSWSYLGFRVAAWGLVPAVLAPCAPLLLVSAVVLALDLVVFGWSTLGAQLAGLVVALVPAQLFHRWTRDRSHLKGRVAFHFLYHSALLLWFVPAAILDVSGGAFELIPLSRLDKVVLQIVVLPGVLGVAAMLEFRDRGRGTPMPLDPPLTLVTTGPYAYVRNPFQIAKVLLLFGGGLFLQSGWLVAASGAVFVYGITVARWSENRELSERFGEAWRDYRRHVRPWIPRWRPWRDPARPNAAFLFDGDCRQCRHVAAFLSNASSLELVPGDRDLLRMTYDPRDGGATETGIAALGRALEHLHLGWAFLGWSLRVPVLRPLFQLIADAVTPARESPAASEGRLRCDST